MSTHERAGLTLTIKQDNDPLNPREDHNAGVMFCRHRRYRLGDDDALPPPEDAVVLPLYLYDHSGLTMRTTPFSCPWDSGQVGVIYMTREIMLKEFGIKRLTAKARKRVEDYLRGEVSTYDSYLRGDVYGYVIEDAHGNHIDSCWGFIGDKSYCEQEGLSALAFHASELEEQSQFATAPSGAD